MMCTHSETLWCIFLFRERTVLFESAGQYRHAFKVSQEYLSGSKEKPHLFLCVAVVFGFTARHCKLVPQTQASALIISQMKLCSNNVPCLTLLYQEIDELLPNLQGVHVFFSLPSRKLRGQRMILPRKEPNLSFIQPFRLMGEAEHSSAVHCAFCTAISEH